MLNAPFESSLFPMDSGSEDTLGALSFPVWISSLSPISPDLSLFGVPIFSATSSGGTKAAPINKSTSFPYFQQSPFRLVISTGDFHLKSVKSPFKGSTRLLLIPPFESGLFQMDSVQG